EQEEALEVANRIVVMDNGRIEQIGTPGEVYDYPATAFVHGFIGESVVLPVNVTEGRVWIGNQALKIDAPNVGGPSKLYVRRHDMQVGSESIGLRGAVRHVRSFGAIQRADIAICAGGDETVIEIDTPRDHALRTGETVELHPRRYRIFAD
ncbi:MAG: TOBE-like domain-containing protein, partial [Rhizobiales bacterium]|nr:TOBE-like domain-containing protein [Hyphomicrobiales bacterium]